MYPNRRVRAHQQRGLRCRASNSDAYEFFNLLTSPDLLDEVEAQLPEHRERLFPPTETLSMFFSAGAERGSILPASRQCGGRAALDARDGGLQHPHRRVLSRPSALACGDGSYAGSVYGCVDRTAFPENLALARSGGTASGWNGRDRNAGCPAPLAQIPACATNALGSCLGFWRQSVEPGNREQEQS